MLPQLTAQRADPFTPRPDKPALKARSLQQCQVTGVTTRQAQGASRAFLLRTGEQFHQRCQNRL